MKFAIAITFTLALAMSVANASVIPWGWPHSEVAGHGLSYTAVSGPAVWPGAWPGAVAVHAPAAVAVHAPAAVAVHAAVHHAAHPHAVWAGHGHGAAVVAAHAPAVVVAHGHEGTYVAQTRGAVHTAPLAGHAVSAAAINVAPAPGTV